MLFASKLNLCKVSWPLFTKLVLILSGKRTCLFETLHLFCVCRPPLICHFSLGYPDFTALIAVLVGLVNMSALGHLENSPKSPTFITNHEYHCTGVNIFIAVGNS